jgi:Fuc2NAc and GlcNAc transferase
VQLISVGIGIALLYPLAELPLIAGYNLNFNSLFMPIAVLALLWLINLYNFMDGIDGIAASEAVATLLPASLALYLAGETNLAMLLSIFACIIIGFLVLNWPPAKLFMGDIGSTFIGLTLGLIALITAESISLWFWVIILGCFIGDASWTLLTRILTGQQWREGHRLHAYQKMSPSPKTHKRTTLIYTAITILWLAPLAILASENKSNCTVITTAAYLPIFYMYFRKKAGRE